MIYNKHVWEDRIVQYPNRYKDQNDNLLTLTQEPGEIAKIGDVVDAEKMNNLENGVEYLYKVRNFSYIKTLLVDNWEENEATGYYEYDISDVNISSETIVNGMLDIDNQYKLNRSYTESYDGGFKIITTKLPEDDITITFSYSITEVLEG